MNKPICYTGIGARKTPEPILQNMQSVGVFMAQSGYTLRSGAAHGADAAFEAGCDKAQGKKEIFLPWEKFNGHDSNHYISSLKAFAVSRDIAEKYNPSWDKLSDGAKRMMTRNVQQIFGDHLINETKLIICWTPEGKITGGTGQALRIAKDHKIPILNFGSQDLPEIEKELLKFQKENPIE